MKFLFLFSAPLALSMGFIAITSPVMALTRFDCPSADSVLPEWNKTLTEAITPNISAEISAAQIDAYKAIWNQGLPNERVLINQIELYGKAYDVLAVKGDFVWNPDYLDSFGVIFEAGESIPLATIKTDTDRSDFICIPFDFPSNVLVDAEEFDRLTIDNAVDLNVTIEGITYDHFYPISDVRAEAQNANGEIVYFVRGE